MNKYIFLSLLLLPAALAGCISTSEPVFSKHYTINAEAGQAANAEANGNASGRILRIADIDAPGWLDSTNMYYRLNYSSDNRIAAYSRSDWVAPPAKLLVHLLQNTLTAAPQWKAVLGPGDVAASDLTLRIQLNDFEQVFSAKEHSAGLLNATATLIGNNASKVIAQRQFHIEEPAPSADAQGGVKALNQASHEFAQRLKQWLGQVVR